MLTKFVDVGAANRFWLAVMTLLHKTTTNEKHFSIFPLKTQGFR